MMVVLDSESGKEITSVPLPEGVDDLHYDASRKKLYASCGEGFVAVIAQTSADKYELVEKVPTAKQARTSFLDSAAGRLYVAVPRQSGKPGPEIRVFKIKD